MLLKTTEVLAAGHQRQQAACLAGLAHIIHTQMAKPAGHRPAPTWRFVDRRRARGSGVGSYRVSSDKAVAQRCRPKPCGDGRVVAEVEGGRGGHAVVERNLDQPA